MNWGVLSTARIGRDWVIPAIQHSSNGQVTSIASRDENKARKISSSLGIPNHYGDYQKLLESDELDIVYIPLPNSMHHEWTILAAESGKHVLCEKPLALNAREAEEMISACRKAGVWLLEGFMYRHYLHIAKLREMLESGRIGNVSVARIEFTFRLDDPSDIRLQKQLGGGALYDLGCYCVDFSRLIFHSEPDKVKAIAHYTEDGVDNTLTGMMRFQNGQISLFDCGFQTIQRSLVDLLGEKGTLTLMAAFEPGFQPAIMLRTEARSESFQCEKSDPYRLMAEHFVESIQSDKAPAHTPDDSLKNMRLIDALYESAKDDTIRLSN
jgi:predicted dehydrogenase